MLEVAISTPLQHTNTMLNGSKAFLGSGDGKLDHGSSLLRAQLESVALIGHNGAKLHRELASLACLDQWKVPHLDGDVVSTAEVAIDADVLISVVLTVLVLEDSVLGMSTTLLRLEGKLLDGVLLVVWKMSVEVNVGERA